MSQTGFDAVITPADLIDRLCVELIKCSQAQHAIIAERKKANPDPTVIAQQELITRVAGERRVAIKDEYNRRLNEAIQAGGFTVLQDVRTYDLNGVKGA